MSSLTGALSPKFCRNAMVALHFKGSIIKASSFLPKNESVFLKIHPSTSQRTKLNTHISYDCSDTSGALMVTFLAACANPLNKPVLFVDL